jgi:signal transduction histidine kinase
VRLRLIEGDDVEVDVEGNGIGFDPKRADAPASKTGGFGLFSVRERTGYLEGRMVIDAAPGKGCRFALKVPLRLS